MASAFTHSFVGVMIGKTVKDGQKMPLRFWVGLAACSALPDLDVIGRGFGVPYASPYGHRGFTHSLFFAAVLAWFAIEVLSFTEKRFSKVWWVMWSFFFTATASHGFLDAFTNGGQGIAFFWPFDNTRYFFPWRPIDVSPLSVQSFFNRHPLVILKNEFLWVWLPTIFLYVFWKLAGKKICSYLFLAMVLTVLVPIGTSGKDETGLKEKTPVPIPQSKDYHPLHIVTPGHIRLALAGDINLARRVETCLDEEGKGWVFSACKPVLDCADLVVANLESPVGEGGKPLGEKEVYLKGRQDSLDALSYGGIGLVTLANNHILDYGPEVMNQTIDGLKQRGILYTGLLGFQGQSDPAVYVKANGLTLAFLGYCSVCPGYFASRKGRPGVDVAIAKVMAPEVKRAKTKADFVIVLVHWGTEYESENELQKKIALSLSKAGADLVVGAHPHVLQKVEKIDHTLVIYSLGNFLFDLSREVCQDSCVLLVDLAKGKEPLWQAVPMNLKWGRPEPVVPTDDQALRIQNILKSGFDYGIQKVGK